MWGTTRARRDGPWPLLPQPDDGPHAGSYRSTGVISSILSVVAHTSSRGPCSATLRSVALYYLALSRPVVPLRTVTVGHLSTPLVGGPTHRGRLSRHLRSLCSDSSGRPDNLRMLDLIRRNFGHNRALCINVFGSGPVTTITYFSSKRAGTGHLRCLAIRDRGHNHTVSTGFVGLICSTRMGGNIHRFIPISTSVRHVVDRCRLLHIGSWSWNWGLVFSCLYLFVTCCTGVA